MLNSSYRQFPQLPHAIHPLRTALALGCSALALIGCGGGSDDAPPPPAPTLAAPTNFTYIQQAFRWTATPGATRYELYVDPDGPGPLPESKQPDASADNGGKGFRFNAYSEGSQRFHGAFSDDNFNALGLATTINATYRLRACDAQGCGSFTAPIVTEYSYELPSGRVPISDSQSKDGLTLVIRQYDYVKKIYEVAVFTRSSLAHPWQQQAVLGAGAGFSPAYGMLSDDGNTLAINEWQPSEGTTPSSTRTHIYQRSGSTWSQQATLDYSNLRADCLLQPCRAQYVRDSKLSADGNVLAQTINFHSSVTAGGTNAVVVHARNGATWSPQALLETGDDSAYTMALARDGKTLAVNQGSDYSPSFALVFAQQSNGTWSQQARIPVGTMYIKLGLPPLLGGMQLSDDGNTLAVLALNWDTPGPAVQAADLSCSPASKPWSYIALFTRNGTAWQRQAVISRGYEYRSSWALARDGNALFYGNELFTRSNGVWTCP